VLREDEITQEESALKRLKGMFFDIPGVDTSKATKFFNSVQTQYKQHLIKVWQDLLNSWGGRYEKPRDPTKQRSFQWFDADDVNVFNENHGRASIHKLKIEEWKKTSNQKTNVREMLQVIFVFCFCLLLFCFVPLFFNSRFILYVRVFFVCFVCADQGQTIERLGCCCQHHQNGTNPLSQGGVRN
jgi:lipopolysaccharide export LptBFGC system permease protein LptF